MFDYDEFTEEGYEAIDEEIDQSLFEFFVSDYEAEVSFFNQNRVLNRKFVCLISLFRPGS